MTYVLLNEQVTFRIVGVIKPLLIDLEFLEKDNKAELARDRERLSEEDVGNNVSDSLNSMVT